MIDIIIPLAPSAYHGLELKYAIRSISKYLSGVRYIHQVTGEDNPSGQFKERNIYQKITNHLPNLTDTFMVYHDDHYLTRPYIADQFPWNYQEPKQSYTSSYFLTMRNTFAITGGKRDYDVHCPFVCTKEGWSKLAQLDWDVPFGYGIKNMYAHLNGIDGQTCVDLKIKTIMSSDDIIGTIANRDWFSTGDTAWQGGMVRVMNKLYT